MYTKCLYNATALSVLLTMAVAAQKRNIIQASLNASNQWISS